MIKLGMLNLRSFFSVAALALLLAAIGASGPACSSSTPKTCTTAEVQKCDDGLTACLAKAPCNDATNPGFQACVDACKKEQCDCQTACGNMCTRS